MKSLIALLPLLIIQAPEKQTAPKPPFSLRIDQETYITDTKGVANPSTVIGLKPGDAVKMYFVDGTCFTALVRETTMIEGGVFKVFGEMISHTNTGFGFVLTKDGIFAGAIVQRNSNTVHQLVYDEEAKGYIFKFQKQEKQAS